MILATPWVVIFVFSVAIVVAIVASYKYKNNGEYQKSKINIFSSSLAASAVFLTAILYFNLVQIHNRQFESEQQKEMDSIDKALLNDLNTEMKTSADKIPVFVESINPLSGAVTGKVRDEETTTNKLHRCTISSMIFNLWQRVIVGGRLVCNNSKRYIAKFLQMAQSDLLKEEWLADRHSRPEPVKEFGDLLFSAATGVSDSRDPKSYSDIADSMLLSEEYRTIKKSAVKFCSKK